MRYTPPLGMRERECMISTEYVYIIIWAVLNDSLNVQRFWIYWSTDLLNLSGLLYTV